MSPIEIVRDVNEVRIYRKRDGDWRVVCRVVVVDGKEIRAQYCHVEELTNGTWLRRECGRVPINEQPFYTGIAITAHLAGIQKVVLS